MNNFVKLFILICISVVLVVLSYYREQKNKIKKDKLADGRILLIRFAHYLALLSNIIYIFMFDPSWDLLYIICSLVMFFHWSFFNNECILGYLENSYYHDNYKAGERQWNSYYLRTLLGDYNRPFLFVAGIISYVSFVIVSYRYPIPVPFGVKFVFHIFLLGYLLDMSKSKIRTQNTQ
jgi:hypothetical protein